MNQFFWDSFTEIDYTAPFFDPSGGFFVGSVADTDLVFWYPGKIMVRFFAVTLEYFLLGTRHLGWGRIYQGWDVCYHIQIILSPHRAF